MPLRTTPEGLALALVSVISATDREACARMMHAAPGVARTASRRMLGDLGMKGGTATRLAAIAALAGICAACGACERGADREAEETVTAAPPR